MLYENITNPNMEYVLIVLSILFLPGIVTGTCPTKSEMAILMDESGSIGSSNFAKMKQFVKNFVGEFDIGLSANRFTIITFSHLPRIQISLNAYYDIYTLPKAIEAINYNAGGTDIASAFSSVRSQFQIAREGVPKILLLITDGQSGGSVRQEADKLKKNGVIIFCLGVGNGVNAVLLKDISSHETYTTFVKNFDVLFDIKTQLSKQTCSEDINECLSNPCQNGHCVDEVGKYTCVCQPGFYGSHCECENICTSVSPCHHGGQCKPEGCSTYSCTCPANWQGTNCETDVDECQSIVCAYGGTCTNTPGSFYCTCAPGWTGRLCDKDVNECMSGAACKNGGTCFNNEGSFSCFCPSQWTGSTCEIDVNECNGVTPVCFNGGTCHNIPGAYTCDCPSGWTGSNCNIDINECLSAPCSNCGQCLNMAGNYICNCGYGYTGRTCDTDINECSGHATVCENGGTCRNFDGFHTCECSSRFSGEMCEEDRHLCEDTPCLNNGTCIDNGLIPTCTCANNYTGEFCQEEKTMCSSMPCKNNGTCLSDSGSARCKCFQGFDGEFCEDDIDECMSNPCPENTICTNRLGGYSCNCTVDDKNNTKCDQSNVEEYICEENVCKNGGICTNVTGNVSCTCHDGWNGTLCDLDIDECEKAPCFHGICSNLNGSYDCSCSDGFTGKRCDQDIDECMTNPCLNDGHCLNSYGSFTCLCQNGYDGHLCERDVDECQKDPCYAGSTCTNTNGGFICCCPQGRQGRLCESDIDECLFHPCKNNGTCTNTFGDYSCQCTPYFTSKNCEQDINECNNSPCQNGGFCDNSYGGLACRCLDGWKGTYCDGDIDECLEDKPCQNGGICENKNDHLRYVCHCPNTANNNWAGKNCTQDIDECLHSPCLNGGSCVNEPGTYRCMCAKGFTGRNCETDIDECKNNPCFPNAACENTFGSFLCHCGDNWDGRLCGIDLCKTKPASLVFLLDTSYSTSAQWFRNQLNYVSSVVKRITIADDRFRVAVITYSTDALVDVGFKSYSDKDDLLQRISNITYKNGTTDIKAVSEAVITLLPISKGAAQYVFLLTDGMPSNLSAAVQSVSLLRFHLLSSNHDNKLFLVSAGHDVRPEGIMELSGDPFYFRDVHTTRNNDALFQTFHHLVDKKCTACSSDAVYTTDLVFLVDTSFIQPDATFILQTHALGLIIEQLRILHLGSDDTQVSIVAYSCDIIQTVWLNTTYELSMLASYLSSMKKDDTNTTSNHAHALQHVRQEVFSSRHGARTNSRKIVVFSTSGYDVDMKKTSEEIKKLKDIGVLVVNVGVGREFDDDVVLETASDALLAVFVDDDVAKVTDNSVRMLLKHVQYRECTSRVNA